VRGKRLCLLFLLPRPHQAIEFDPQGTDAVPRLFDEFDRLGDATADRDVRGELPAGYESVFRYSLLDPGADVAAEAAAFRPPFGHLALLVQAPGVDVGEQMATEKASKLTDREREILDRRVRAARAWLDAYAPESARVEVHREQVPAAAGDLTNEQRDFLRSLAEALEGQAPESGADWQNLIFEVAKSAGLAARPAFEAIYRAFLGRANGPRAGWLLATLEPEFVRERAWQASGWTAAGPGADPIPVGG
jgi:lysyl-tRNA synthetase, class I